jgi:hypothetical protein
VTVVGAECGLKWCVTILYSELLAAALRYRYATHKFFTSSTDINKKNLVVRASCPHKVYLTQSELAILYSDRHPTPKVYTNGALRIQLTHPTIWLSPVPCPLFPVPCL